MSTDERSLDRETAQLKLGQKLKFSKVLSDVSVDAVFCSHQEGKLLSKKLVQFWRHDLASSGLKFSSDESVLLGDLLVLWEVEGFACSAKKVIEACKPKCGNKKT